MGLDNTPEYKGYLEMIKKVDFTTTKEGLDEPGEVSLFELNIR
jgi:hypothetical protein